MVRGSVIIVLDLSLLGFVGIIAMAGVRDWRLWRVSRRVTPITPDQLVEAAGSRRRMRELVAVVGVAAAGRGGPLESTVNAQPCVWHRHTVHHRRVRHGSDGRSRRSLRRRRVVDETTHEPFALAGTTSRIQLQPEGFHMDRPARTPTRVLPGLVSQPFPDADGLMGRDVYVHREWIIPSGTTLYVLAEAAAAPSGIVLRRPAKGPHLVSTRGVSGARRHALTSTIAAFVLAAVALVAAVFVFTLF